MPWWMESFRLYFGHLRRCFTATLTWELNFGGSTPSIKYRWLNLVWPSLGLHRVTSRPALAARLHFGMDYGNFYKRSYNLEWTRVQLGMDHGYFCTVIYPRMEHMEVVRIVFLHSQVTWVRCFNVTVTPQEPPIRNCFCSLFGWYLPQLSKIIPDGLVYPFFF